MYRLDGVEVRALDGVDLEVAPGDSLAIMGPSGSGKSTLLGLLGGLDRPTSGTLRFQGRDVTRLSDDELAVVRNRVVGFVFQSFQLLGNLSALENVMLPLELEGVEWSDWGKPERIETARVTHTADSHAFRLSTAGSAGLVYSGDCGRAHRRLSSVLPAASRTGAALFASPLLSESTNTSMLRRSAASNSRRGSSRRWRRVSRRRPCRFRSSRWRGR